MEAGEVGLNHLAGASPSGRLTYINVKSDDRVLSA